MPPASPSSRTSPSWRRLRVGAWVLYDLANTVYAATLTFLLTPHIKARLGGLTTMGAVNFASMAVAGVLVPVLGALVDHTTRTRRYLAIATLLCITALAGCGLDAGPGLLLGCFFVANLAYNVALLFYNALLPAVASDERIGRTSGLGVGVGYFGTILVLAVLLPLPLPVPQRFPIAAGLFLLTALPCLVLVQDPRPPRPGHAGAAVRAAVRATGRALRELPQHRPLFWFLLANFCLVDVLNTAVLYFAEFTVAVFRDQALAGELVLFGHRFAADAELTDFLQVMGLALNALALLFGILLGRWSDRAPLGVMRLSALGLLGALIGGTVFGGHSALGYLLTLVGLGALGLAGLWTAGRKVVVLLAPRARLGEYFGLYGITTKLSVLGSLTYGSIADHFGARPGMLAQAVPLLLGLALLAMVRLPAADHDR
ncbi:MAG: MFS transporter [Planctomycetes bacterium]|nr:MFS transporter [Planctomycetota bacterium]